MPTDLRHGSTTDIVAPVRRTLRSLCSETSPVDSCALGVAPVRCTISSMCRQSKKTKTGDNNVAPVRCTVGSLCLHHFASASFRDLLHLCGALLVQCASDTITLQEILLVAPVRCTIGSLGHGNQEFPIFTGVAPVRRTVSSLFRCRPVLHLLDAL